MVKAIFTITVKFQRGTKGLFNNSKRKKSQKEKCAEKGGFGVETKGAESKGGYDENASTTTAAADSAYALFACKGPK